ncbi:hypothetical protein N0V84_000053 [Fusarium piperis]|uniref:Uncharacterized protein n=1 Tax=Fusarium piperis TaxID=1435070 RepID=A0A9W9BUA1_9HYPO|nr:hypothetical protein N0V84_000053 [Fusarium piperis]
MSFVAGVPMKMSLISSNVGGFTRKATFNAVSPDVPCQRGPRYQTAFIGMIGYLATMFVEAIVLLIYLERENRRRDKVQAKRGETASEEQDEIDNFPDKTDRENITFRYVY